MNMFLIWMVIHLCLKPFHHKCRKAQHYPHKVNSTGHLREVNLIHLKNNPLTIEFIVQDQPYKAETKGKIRIAQTQLDLPPELLIVPGDSLYSIKEDETLNLKIYVSDPNGDENVRNAGFVSSDLRIPASTLKENTPLQYEFIWLPGYDFVEETQKLNSVEITFFALDKSNNRIQRKIQIQITDTENVVEKDAHQYDKYKGNLTSVPSC
jgi:hypothetical protein